MNESVLAAIIGLNEAGAVRRIVSLHCAYSHDDPLLDVSHGDAIPRREIFLDFRC